MDGEGPAKVGTTQPLPYPSRPHVTLQHAQKHNLDHHGVEGAITVRLKRLLSSLYSSVVQFANCFLVDPSWQTMAMEYVRELRERAPGTRDKLVAPRWNETDDSCREDDEPRQGRREPSVEVIWTATIETNPTER
jgi:hypothetical protein